MQYTRTGKGLGAIVDAVMMGGVNRDKAYLDAMSDRATMEARRAAARNYNADADATEYSTSWARRLAPDSPHIQRSLAVGDTNSYNLNRNMLLGQVFDAAAAANPGYASDPVQLDRMAAIAGNRSFGSPYAMNEGGFTINQFTGELDTSSDAAVATIDADRALSAARRASARSHDASAAESMAKAAMAPFFGFSNGTVIDARPMLGGSNEPGSILRPKPPGPPVVHTGPGGGVDLTSKAKNFEYLVKQRGLPPQEAMRLAFGDSVKLVRDPNGMGVMVVDMSDPRNPVNLGTMDPASATMLPPANQTQGGPGGAAPAAGPWVPYGGAP